MAVAIEVTGRVVGLTVLYELLNQQGRQCQVPVYQATMELWGSDVTNPHQFAFAVTRDVSPAIFDNLPDRYGRFGECPPSRPHHPYHGKEHLHRKTSFAIRLHESDDVTGHFLQGEGSTSRQNILIHKGPGSSKGCMMVDGGTEGFVAFTDAFRRLRLLSPGDDTILVAVEPRTQPDLIRPGG